MVSREFFWDMERKKLIFRRCLGGLAEEGRNIKYIFSSVEDLIRFLTESKETLIWSEYDLPHMVGSLRNEMIEHGVIIIKMSSEGRDER